MLLKFFTKNLLEGWICRVQSASTLGSSEPEPDLAIVRGTERTYASRHPGTSDFGIIIEVADTTLNSDRIDKGRIYSRAEIPEYWIVNLVDRCIEIHRQPLQNGDVPKYASRTIIKADEQLILELDGKTIASINVSELMP